MNKKLFSSTIVGRIGFVMLSVVLLLQACGGGGGGGSGGGGAGPALMSLFAGNVGGAGNLDGTGSAARFNIPYGIATDSAGNVYVADSGNNTIRKITPAGVVTTLAGSAGVSGSSDGTGSAARFNILTGVATDSAGNVYVADNGNSTIRKITPAGVVTTVVGAYPKVGFQPGGLPGAISSPHGLSIFGRTLYFTANSGIVQVTNLP